MPKHQECQLTAGSVNYKNTGVIKVDKNTKSLRSLHFIITHSKEHTEWALQAKHQLIDTLGTLAPTLAVSVDLLLIAGTQMEITQLLAQYYAAYSQNECDQTFIITPGWWESQFVVLANAGGVLPYKQWVCLPGGEPSRLLQRTLVHNVEEVIVGGVYNMAMRSERYVNSIIGFRPYAKKVCIVYDPNTSSDILRDNLRAQVAELTEKFKQQLIDVSIHNWTSQDMNSEGLRLALDGADSVITLHEPAAAAHKRALIKFCNALNIFVCSSELDSVNDGAALGCGITGAAFTVPLAALIVEYLFFERGLEQSMGWSLYRIPQQSGMRFNDCAFEPQGVELSKDREELIRMKSASDVNVIEY
jgi:hypothetical protein